MGERRYPIKNPRQRETLTEAFQAKLNANSERGKATYASGHVEPFQGYTKERMGGEFEFKLELSLPTQREIIERTVEPLKDISSRHGIEQFYPYDRELAPHVTFEVAKFQDGITPEEKNKLIEDLEENSRLAVLARVLKGLDFAFDTAVTAGRDTYLCIGEFGIDTGAIHKARRIIERTMKSSGLLMPINYQDIVHATIGRVFRAPENPEALLAYAADVEKEIGKPLSENPIIAVIDNVYYGSALKYHIEHASPQLKE